MILLISATGAHVILMAGRKALKIKGFWPVFFYRGNEKKLTISLQNDRIKAKMSTKEVIQ